jgi:Na+-driven multidrug efflux pump
VLCFTLGLGVRGLWIGLSTGLIFCGVILTWAWSRRIAHYQLTWSTR